MSQYVTFSILIILHLWEHKLLKLILDFIIPVGTIWLYDCLRNLTFYQPIADSDKTLWLFLGKHGRNWVQCHQKKQCRNILQLSQSCFLLGLMVPQLWDICLCISSSLCLWLPCRSSNFLFLLVVRFSCSEEKEWRWKRCTTYGFKRANGTRF